MKSSSVAIHTLGCKLNFSESSAIMRSLEDHGFAKREFEELADVYVINTCSVTNNADKECRQLIRRIKSQAPESKIVITGCYAQLKPEELSKMESVDLVIGVKNKFDLPHILQEFFEHGDKKVYACHIDDVTSFNGAYSLNDRTRTFLKVQDGCDYSCSFCTIPMARGKSRSHFVDNVMKDIDAIAAKGVKEIVLTGVNLGDFGKGISGGKYRQETFLELLQEIEKSAPVDRFRISSIEPNLLTEDIISLVSGSQKLLPHFHIPLQSGSNRILGLMKRRYKKELYEEKITRIKAVMPHCCIGADVIVGFPSESDDDFRQTVNFIESLPLSYLHVFTYSERAHTDAMNIAPTVPVPVRNTRNRFLRDLSEKKMAAFVEEQKGTRRPVLFESRTPSGLMEGYTDNYIRIRAPFREDWINAVVRCTIES